MDFGWLARGVAPVQLPDPVQELGKAMSLQQLARQNELGRMQMDERRRGLAAQDALNSALPAVMQGGWSEESIRDAISQNPQSAGPLLDMLDKKRKSDADYEKTRAGAFKDTTEAKTKAFQDISSAAFAEAKNPDHLSLSRVASVAKAYGLSLPEFSGDPQNPADVQRYLAATGNMAYAAKDQVANELTGKRDAETGRHNLSTEGLTARGQDRQSADAAAGRGVQMTIAKMNDERQREATQAAREAASGSKINSETQALSKFVEGNALPNLLTSANALDATIQKYANAKDMPGVGMIDSNKPVWLQSAEGNKIKSQIQAVSNDLLKLYSGGAVTANEAERRATEMMASGSFNETDLRNAWPLVKGRIDAAAQNVRAGFSPEAVDTYEKRGGIKLKPVGESKPAAPQMGEVRDGYRFLGGDPADPKRWRKEQ